ncbi:RnfH family protein [Hydrocarboniphaga effusa]|uniref:RnfH family protein n=1 Tax=Hydrocarboniphaga effusa TaxID=243629 RepID=UPI00058BB80C|nr:RnfH family protein [Hydrocarboniphaga effusa]
MIAVEVCHALPARIWRVRLQLAGDATVGEAIEASGLAAEFPELDVQTSAIGIFSRPCGLQDGLRDGDRIEIYRPLIHDPKDARRSRARREGRRR